MAPNRNRDGQAGEDPQQVASPEDQKQRGREPDDTGELVLTATDESDDADVLRAVLARLDRDLSEVHDVLVQLGPDFFSEANGWRRLFVRLVDAPEDAAAFKCRALADYLEWLEKTRGALTSDDDEEVPVHMQTIAPGSSEGTAHLAKLVPGKPTAVHFGRVKRIECRLGQCVLWISPGEPPQLAITGQHSLPLTVGSTLVGRALDNEVVLAERWPGASRRHLLIEMTRGYDIVLTDLSTHGTSVTAAAI